MERISFLPSYIDMEMRGRRKIYKGRKEERREKTKESLIYISYNKAGEEKVIFVKMISSVPRIVKGYCPKCKQPANLLGFLGTDYYQCFACGIVSRECDIIRESIRRWWL